LRGYRLKVKGKRQKAGKNRVQGFKGSREKADVKHLKTKH
jgi:hypothetical protein